MEDKRRTNDLSKIRKFEKIEEIDPKEAIRRTVKQKPVYAFDEKDYLVEVNQDGKTG